MTLDSDLKNDLGRNEINKKWVFDKFGQHVSSGKVAFFKEASIEFVLGKREGCYLWDYSSGKQLIDCHCNGGVFNLGHRNPAIVETLVSHLNGYDIGNHHLISEPRALLAAKLAELTPQGLDHVVFGVSGGEAIDLAIKVARAHTKRSQIISFTGGYHGHTGLALATGDEKYRAPFEPLAPGFLQVPYHDFEALKKTASKNTAAIIIETVPATAGILVPEKIYLQEIRSLCDQLGILLIVDEVQTGLGRTGKLWGIDHYDISPDIMVLGKGLSGGIYPITATCMRAELEDVFLSDPFIHISTFGGAEIGCFVALKVLEISSNPSFLKRVNQTAEKFSAFFKSLQKDFPSIIAGAHQLGMMMGLKFTHPKLGPVFTKCAFDEGFLAIYANNDTSIAQILPPLIISDAEIEALTPKIIAATKKLTHFY